MSEYLFNKYFTHPYVKTCHSCQGTTIKDKFIIFDWKYNYVSTKWLYTAISRCSDINNVYFYDGDDNKSFKLSVNILSYKDQDKKANRKYKQEDYITLDWVVNQIKQQKYVCAICKDVLNGISVDRVSNNKAHVKNNC